MIFHTKIMSTNLFYTSYGDTVESVLVPTTLKKYLEYLIFTPF